MDYQRQSGNCGNSLFKASLGQDHPRTLQKLQVQHLGRRSLLHVSLRHGTLSSDTVEAENIENIGNLSNQSLWVTISVNGNSERLLKSVPHAACKRLAASRQRSVHQMLKCPLGGKQEPPPRESSIWRNGASLSHRKHSHTGPRVRGTLSRPLLTRRQVVLPSCAPWLQSPARSGCRVAASAHVGIPRSRPGLYHFAPSTVACSLRHMP